MSYVAITDLEDVEDGLTEAAFIHGKKIGADRVSIPETMHTCIAKHMKMKTL